MIFYMSSYCIYPLNIKQIAIIGLMLSVTALSCQCGTNELSGFPIPFNWVSYVGFNFTEFTKVARLDACLFHMLKDSRQGWNQHREDVEIRRSVRPVLKGACFVKPYVLQTKLHNLSNSFNSMLIGQLLNFLNILTNFVSRFCFR